MYVCSVDEGFPVITFQFDNSISLPVYPHNYLFEVRVSKRRCTVHFSLFILYSVPYNFHLQDTEFCIGWQTSGMQAKDGQELTLLGGIYTSMLSVADSRISET